MKTYAHVTGIPGIVRAIETIAPIAGVDPVIGRDIIPASEAPNYIDLTSLSPQPQQGWSYDGKVFTAPAVVAPDPKLVARATLATLDLKVPRGLEDYWTAAGFDTTKLPAASQQILAAKVAARAVLAGS